jgi:hypothetical protein
MPKRQLVDIFKKIDRKGPIPISRSDLGPCWIWLGTYNERRRMPEWYCAGERLIPYRVTWELIKGEPWPNNYIALHQCDNRKCCNPGHYHPGTVAQNNAEKEIRERDNGMGHRDVRIVRFLIDYGVTRKVIATLMEVSVSTIHAIATGQNHSRTADGLQYKTQKESDQDTQRQSDGTSNEVLQQSKEEESDQR